MAYLTSSRRRAIKLKRYFFTFALEDECVASRKSGRPPKPKKSVEFTSPLQSGSQKRKLDQSDSEVASTVKSSDTVSQSIASKVEATLLALKKKKAEKLAALEASQREQKESKTEAFGKGKPVKGNYELVLLY